MFKNMTNDAPHNVINTAKKNNDNFDNSDVGTQSFSILQTDKYNLIHQLAKCIYHILKRRTELITLNAELENIDNNRHKY